LVGRSVNQLTDRSVNQSVDRSINQSIDWWFGIIRCQHIGIIDGGPRSLYFLSPELGYGGSTATTNRYLVLSDHRSVGWLVDRLIGWLIGRSVDWLIGRSVGFIK
jgi:hypothetical protein